MKTSELVQLIQGHLSEQIYICYSLAAAYMAINYPEAKKASPEYDTLYCIAEDRQWFELSEQEQRIMQQVWYLRTEYRNYSGSLALTYKHCRSAWFADELYSGPARTFDEEEAGIKKAQEVKVQVRLAVLEKVKQHFTKEEQDAT